MSSLKDAALRYAREGFPVLPVWWLRKARDGSARCACGDVQCDTPGKHPLIKAWQNKATTNEKQLVVWWQRWPDAHIGIMPKPGTCVIDIDPRNGGEVTLRKLLAGDKAATTVIQKSGGGGLHLFYEGEPGGTLGKGIDVKKAGRGFVVAWPSMHESGRRYQWRADCAPWEQEIVPLPESLSGRSVSNTGPGSEFSVIEGDDEDAPRTAKIPKVEVEVIREALAHIDAGDYARWINIGHALRHAYGQKGFALWEDWSRSSEKFQEHDLNKWNTFDRNRDRALWTIRSVMALARKGGYRPLTREFSQGIWVIGDTEYAFNNEHGPVPLEWVFDGRIAVGKVTVVAGAGGSSKSFLMLQLAIAFAAGESLGPFEPGTVGKALILTAEEDKDDIHRRIHAIQQQQGYTEKQRERIIEHLGVASVRGLDWRMLAHDEFGDLQETNRVDYLIEQIKPLHDMKLVVIDPLVFFNGGSENDNEEMARLMLALDRIAATCKCAVVVVHHVSKGGQVTSLQDATQSVVRGASALVDNARASMLLTRLPRRDAPLYGLAEDDAGRYVVARFVKNNYGPHTGDVFFEVGAHGVLRHAPDIQQIESNVKEAAKLLEDQSRMERVLLAVKAGKGEATLLELAEAAKLTIMQTRVEIKKCAEVGLIDAQGVGAWKRYTITKLGGAQLAKFAEKRQSNDDAGDC